MNKFENIDLNRISRDYLKFPLLYTGIKRKIFETPKKEDIEYLYLELNFFLKDIIDYFQVTECIVLGWFKKYSIKKDKNSHIKNILKTKESNNLTDEVIKYTEKYDYLPSIARKYMFNNNIKEIPLCPICGKEVKWYNSANKFYETCGSKECISKHRQTIGYEKTKKTLLERYNDEHYNNMEKNRETNKKNHNGKIFINTEKIKQTCLERYGVENYMQSEEYKNKYKNEEFVKQVNNKVYQSKQKNNSFNKSDIEKELSDILIEKFPNTKTQYKSDLYPFACDFYIPELDLYIEYQGTWTHGKQPFDKNNSDHNILLKEWKEKSIESKFYKNAIYTWTELDPLKRKIAKENNLNWIEFFNKKEFMKWFESL